MSIDLGSNRPPIKGNSRYLSNSARIHPIDGVSRPPINGAGSTRLLINGAGRPLINHSDCRPAESNSLKRKLHISHDSATSSLHLEPIVESPKISAMTKRCNDSDELDSDSESYSNVGYMQGCNGAIHSIIHLSSSKRRLTTIVFNLILSSAVVLILPYVSSLVQLFISSIHVFLGLPLALLPHTLPSSIYR